MKKNNAHFLSVIAAALFIGQCSTSQISIKKELLAHTRTVAVMKFEAKNGVPVAAAADCENAFRNYFSMSGFNIVERDKLASVLKEQELAQAGVTQESALKAGQLTNADAVLLAEVTDHRTRDITHKDDKGAEYPGKEHTFQLYLRLVSVRTGETILTLHNENPVVTDYYLKTLDTIDKVRTMVLAQMQKDLKKAIDNARK